MQGKLTLFVGIGSPHGDDRIGWLVAESLAGKFLPNIEVRSAATPSHLLDWLDGVERLVVCDACLARGAASQEADGRLSLHRWEWPTLQVASVRSAGSHAFGLPQVLQLAEQLGTLPTQVIVFGVPGTCFDAFADPSPDLRGRLHEIQDTISQELARR